MHRQLLSKGPAKTARTPYVVAGHWLRSLTFVMAAPTAAAPEFSDQIGPCGLQTSASLGI